MSEKLPGLSVMCLAYNEEENVAWAVPLLSSLAQSVALDHEIVIVTSRGSTDRTNEIVDAMGRADPRIRRVDQPANTRGYGPAFAFGLTQVRKAFTFHTDIDGQFDFDELPRAVRLQQETGADLVHFNRRHRKDPLERKIIGLGFKTLVHTFYRCPVWDFDSAFNLFRTSLLTRIPIASNSGMAVPEFMIRMRAAGAKIVGGWTEHRARRAGKPVWEVTDRSRGIVLPDPGIVRANLIDIWRLRGIPGGRFPLAADPATHERRA